MSNREIYIADETKRILCEHDITLYGNRDIVLRPLTDKNLPLLYQWNSDLEVLYWSEGDDIAEPYDASMVDLIYGSVTENAFCFQIENAGTPVGDCWLQKMNIKEIAERYPVDVDVRRIDYCIGEKDNWGQGIGTECLRMLLRFAFHEQKVDVLYIMAYDYNVRSLKMAEHAGFQLEAANPVQDSQKAKYEMVYKLTREDYMAKE